MHTRANEMTNIGHMMTDKTFSYDEMRAAHDAINTAARPAVMMHLVSAFTPPNNDMFRDEHLAAAMHDTKGYLRVHADKIPRTSAEFDLWEGKTHILDAIILDTMMNVQSEMLGGDDSRSDYMPDGLEQIGALTEDSYDGNGFLWYCMNNLHRTIHDPNRDPRMMPDSSDVTNHLYEHFNCISMQDCSSSILYDLSVAFTS